MNGWMGGGWMDGLAGRGFDGWMDGSIWRRELPQLIKVSTCWSEPKQFSYLWGDTQGCIRHASTHLLSSFTFS